MSAGERERWDQQQQHLVWEGRGCDDYQCLGEEIDGEGVGVGEDLSKWPALAEGQGTDVVAGPTSGDRIELVQGGCAQDIEDERQLVVVVPSGEEGLPGQHFGEDAAHRPYVDSLLWMM